MKVSHIVRFWLFVVLFIFATIWLLKDILTPFIIGLIIAYLLDPLVNKLTRSFDLPRWSVVTLVLAVFTTVLVVSFIAVVPFLVDEMFGFYSNLPKYFDKLVEFIQPFVDTVLSKINPDDIEKVKSQMGNNIGTFFSGFGDVVNQIWSSGLALFDVISFLVVTPVVAFYMMLDWDNIRRNMDDLIPRQYLQTIRQLFHEFDETLSGFIRGQTMVCLFLGVFYAIGLTLAGLNFGLAIGFMAGVLSFIPYVGSFFGLLTSVGVAFVQFDDLTRPLIIAAIFILGQAIEGNILTPKWVGKKVGLHAIWVIFALMAGGNILGFTGLLLAMPVAALIGVVVRFSIHWYKNSAYYAPRTKVRKKRKNA